ncbi:exodeoxyribonuclease VII large subunit [Pasteurellaceae bacterium 15-036681]|nr:exodeoxyribonuclease VII large subunit [Pasteurellaceae bacterium 15-036681]
MQQNILTISQLNYSVKHRLEAEFGHVWLVGEISNFSSPVSGHWYLTLKDERAQVRCAMFRMRNMQVKFVPQNGMQVLVRASVSLYEPRGDYQVIIESMQLKGDGLLQQQFEDLKLKLAKEGLFAQEKKKTIPNFVKRVGIITSSSGAALQDILHILARRDPSLQVVIYPTLVQGKEATQEIVKMISLANVRKECDVLIVGRGGGSLEDLWCFNEEAVAYAIYGSQIPIISAVGHETDVTIADFVADLRAPTPSAAAELVSRDQQELINQLQNQFERASLAFDRLWAEKQKHFKQLELRLAVQHPAKQLQQNFRQLTQLKYRIIREVNQLLYIRSQQLIQLEQRVKNQHPVRHLQQQQVQLQQLSKRAEQQITQILLHKQQQLKMLYQSIARNPLLQQLNQYSQQVEQLQQRLIYSMEKEFTSEKQKFHGLCVKLEGLSPLKILSRGYSVTKNAQQKALISSEQVKLGDRLTTHLAEGILVSEVVEIK